MEAFEPGCEVSTNDPPSEEVVPGLQPFKVKASETVQSLIDEAEADSCMKGLYSGGRSLALAANSPQTGDPKTAVAAILPLDDRVKALAKADILKQALNDGGRPQLAVATIRIGNQGADDPSAEPTAIAEVHPPDARPKPAGRERFRAARERHHHRDPDRISGEWHRAAQ